MTQENKPNPGQPGSSDPPQTIDPPAPAAEQSNDAAAEMPTVCPCCSAENHALPPEEASQQAICDRLAARWTELFRMLLGIGFPSGDAPDAVQDAMRRAFRWVNSGRFREIRNETTWLRTVAVRAALTILGRQRAVSLEAGDEPEVYPVEDFDRAEEIRTRRAALDAAIGRLPDDLRAVFRYCAVEGHSLAEAASAFLCPMSTIRGQLARARAALRLDLGVEAPKKNRPGSP